uniref:Uncharacterized protein n=1 Tax=Megaselia scalaris TaxID=36166 RepID=T1GVI1_MEGSC
MFFNRGKLSQERKVPLKKQTYEIINEAPYDEYATEEIEKVSVETMTEHFGPEITVKTPNSAWLIWYLR